MEPVQRKLHVGGCCLPRRDRQEARHEEIVNGIRTIAIAIIAALLLRASTMPESKDQIAFILILMIGFLASMISIHAPQRATRAITATISIFSAAVAWCLYVSLCLPAKLQWVSYLIFGLIMVCLLFGEPNCQSFLEWIHGRIKDIIARRHVAPPAAGAQTSSLVDDSESGQTSIIGQTGAVVVTNV